MGQNQTTHREVIDHARFTAVERTRRSLRWPTLAILVSVSIISWSVTAFSTPHHDRQHPLQLSAIQAANWSSSKMARRFYEMLTCQPKSPVIDLQGYEKYCQQYQVVMAQNRATLTARAKEWFRTKRPQNLPSTVLYPFAKTDLTTSLTVFPKQILHAHVKQATPVRITKLYPLKTHEQLRTLQSLVQETIKDLLYDGYTSSLILRQSGKKERRVDQLSRILMGLAIHEGQLVSFRHFVMEKSGAIRYIEEPKSKRERRHFELSFRLPSDTQVRVLQHVTAELSNTIYQADASPHIRQWIRGLGPVALLIKASDYLLWTKRFSILRSDLIEHAAWMVSDSSGILPWRIHRRRWSFDLYGHYRCPFQGENFKLAMRQQAYVNSGNRLATLLKSRRKGPLPFRFGYLDCQFGGHVILGRPASTPRGKLGLDTSVQSP